MFVGKIKDQICYYPDLLAQKGLTILVPLVWHRLVSENDRRSFFRGPKIDGCFLWFEQPYLHCSMIGISTKTLINGFVVDRDTVGKSTNDEDTLQGGVTSKFSLMERRLRP